jgi:transcriptional regulator with XRE-family HTH domain
MSRTLSSPLHGALRQFLLERRKAANLTQAVVAARLSRPQSYVANIEGGMRKMDVVELIEYAAAVGFDPTEAITHLLSVAS